MDNDRPVSSWRPRLERLAAILGIAVLALGGCLAVGSLFADRSGPEQEQSSNPTEESSNPEAGCPDGEVTVAADPAIAQALADRLAEGSPCLRVTEQPSAALAAELAAGSDPEFDLWIPDSSMWADSEPAANLASSPVVIALPRAVAGERGWPSAQPSWTRITEPTSSLSWTLPDLAHSAATLLAAAPLPDEVVLRGQAGRPVTDVQARLESGRETGALPTSEQIVWQVAQQGGDWVASYDLGPRGRRARLDFPLLRVDGGPGDPAALDEATGELAELAEDPEWTAALAAIGLRPADGAPLPDSGPGSGVLGIPVTRTTALPAGRLTELVGLAQQRSPRVLLVLDTSGSMRETLPDGGTRFDRVRKILTQFVTETPPDSELGLWTFASGAVTQGPVVRVPLGRIDKSAPGETTPRREALLTDLAELEPAVGEATPLFRTVLAAYRTARRGYRDGRLNAVVVLTDGRNEEPGGIDLATLTDRLGPLIDPEQPIALFTVGIGSDADATTLQAIAEAAGGRYLPTPTAEEFGTAIQAAP